MDPMEAIRRVFFQECEEQLAELETGLLGLDGGERSPDVVNAVFRAVHSIKGGAGAFGLDALVRFAHAFETALDALRSNTIDADPAVIHLFLRAADLLADLVRGAQGHTEIDTARAARVQAELAALTSAPAPPGPDLADNWADALAFQPVPVPQPEPTAWQVRLRPHSSLYASGNDPIVLLRELSRLGAASAAIDDSLLPGLDEMEPEAAYLAWTVELVTDRSEAEIREVFEFVEADCDLAIAAVIPEEVPLVEFVPVPVSFEEAPPDLPPAPAAAKPATAPAEPKRPESAAARPTIRVDLDRLDRLIDLVGELVINQAVLAQRVAESKLTRSSGVAVGLEELEHLTRDIQDSVMAIRAQPVKAVFQRLPRLAREVAALTNKHVKLVTEGETT